jgi:RimJ/RimL family protein N-acetyltransferase
MRVFLRTERLVLREFEESDVANLVELDSDPQVMQFISRTLTPESVIRQELLPQFLGEQERDPRRGHWAALERPTGQFLGWFGLGATDGSPGDAKLGYRLRVAAWGMGYGIEGSRALVRVAFEELGAEQVRAEAMAVNVRSRRVMENAGLTYVRTFYPDFDDPIEGTELGEVEYALRRADWNEAAWERAYHRSRLALRPRSPG